MNKTKIAASLLGHRHVAGLQIDDPSGEEP
jgi:hypothetical protein